MPTICTLLITPIQIPTVMSDVVLPMNVLMANVVTLVATIYTVPADQITKQQRSKSSTTRTLIRQSFHPKIRAHSWPQWALAMNP